MRSKVGEDMLPVRSGLGLFRPEFSTGLPRDYAESTQVLSFAALSTHRNPEEKNHGTDPIGSIEATAGRGTDHQAVASSPRNTVRFCQPSQADGFTYLPLRRPGHRRDGQVLQKATATRKTPPSRHHGLTLSRHWRKRMTQGLRLGHWERKRRMNIRTRWKGFTSFALMRSKVPRGYYNAIW